MSEPAKQQVCQIQISPADDGFVIQAVNIDGVRKAVKNVALDIPQLREKLHKIVDVLYDPPPAAPTAEAVKAPTDGQPGTKSTPGTQAATAS